MTFREKVRHGSMKLYWRALELRLPSSRKGVVVVKAGPTRTHPRIYLQELRIPFASDSLVGDYTRENFDTNGAYERLGKPHRFACRPLVRGGVISQERSRLMEVALETILSGFSNSFAAAEELPQKKYKNIRFNFDPSLSMELPENASATPYAVFGQYEKSISPEQLGLGKSRVVEISGQIGQDRSKRTRTARTYMHIRKPK